MWKNDDDIFELTHTKLFPAAVGGVLDAIGCRHQFLSPKIKPVDPLRLRSRDDSPDVRLRFAERHPA